VRDAVSTNAAPAAIGPYSQAVRAGQFLFLSGQIPLDPSTGVVVPGDVATQAHRVMLNIQAVLHAAGATFEHVVRTTIFLADLADFAIVNEVYGGYFGTPPPARSTVQVAGIPKGSRLEIDVIAVLP
jgi:2-iminobutanoate/2-iminopropanoate deaminase